MANRPRSSDEDSGDGEGRVTKRPRPSLEGVDQPADQSPKEVFKPLASTQDVYDEESWPNWTRINRVAGYDYLSLVRRSLASLGFEDIAEELTVADRKWVDYEDDPSNELREHVLNGDWDAAWKEGFGIFRCAGMDEDEAQFLILKQKYVELVHSDRQAALKCLRSEIVPLGVHPSRVQKLAAMLLEPLDEGHSGHSPEEGRRKLLETLASFEEPPSWMIAWTLAKPDRLEELVEQAVIAQMAKCHLHNSARPQKISLLQDYTCGTEQIPQHPMPGVMRHVSEVWHVAFSHSGHAFISVGKDCQAMVWAVEGRKAPSLMCSFTMHHEPITYAAWSPDDSRVVTCDQLGWLFVWSPTVDGAKFITLVRQHDLAATCAAWLPGGKYLVTVSHDEYLVS